MSAIITPDVIQRISTLARLNVDKNVMENTAHHFNNAIQLINRMSAINTDSIEPMAHPFENQLQLLREDNITEKNQREHFQQNAPAVLEGLYIVPKVIE